MIKGGVATPLVEPRASAVSPCPPTSGPRTMDYNALFNAGIYDAARRHRTSSPARPTMRSGSIWAARSTRSTPRIQPPVLSAAQDAANVNLAADYVSGYAVNSIAIEVPIALLTRTGAIEPPTSTAATIGVWATTSRPRTTVRRSPLPAASSGSFRQVQRMGNPLINEFLIGTGFKDRFSMDQPKNDAQFATVLPGSGLARVVNALTGGSRRHPRAAADRSAAGRHLCAADRRRGTPAGPVADLLRLNTGVARRHRPRRIGSGCSAAIRPASPTAAALPTTSPTSPCGWSSAACSRTAVPRLRAASTAGSEMA